MIAYSMAVIFTTSFVKSYFLLFKMTYLKDAKKQNKKTTKNNRGF